MMIDRDSMMAMEVGGVRLSLWCQRWRTKMLEKEHDFDPGHRVDHLDRVFRNARELCQHESVDWAVVMPAVWLHDCVPVSKRSTSRAQASALSSETALMYLNECGYPSQYAQCIRHCIEAHSYSAKIAPETKEARVVQDADRLDALGAVGLARVMMTGADMGSSLYDREDPFAKERDLDDKTYIIDHFYTKLLSLPDTFLTESGRRMAQKRCQLLKQFLACLKDELFC